MPKTKFWQFKNIAGGKSAELLLYGDIEGSGTWWEDKVTPVQFKRDLDSLGAVDEITVRISSGGGDVFAAQTIGNLLEQHQAAAVAKIDGMCGSAATIVACHCEKVIAANDSTYMIHPVTVSLKDAASEAKLRELIDAIATIRENIIGLYAKKTGREKDEVAGWMDATSWWTGLQAKENGFVDELVDDGQDTVVENRNGVLFLNSISMNVPFDEAPQFIQDSLAGGNADSFENTAPDGETNEEDSNMEIKTADELRNAYPQLVDQIEQAAVELGVQNERARIRDIEEMALPGSEEITVKAKFTDVMSASDYAKAVMKHVKTQGASYLQKMKDEAEDSGANGIVSAPPPLTDKGQDDPATAIAQAKKDAAAFMNSAKK